MKKYNYQRNITDHHKKRLLHLLSNGCLVANLIAFSILISDVRAWTLGLAALFVAYTICQLLDKRKSQWAWWVIIFGIVLSVAIPVCYIFLFELYFYFAIIGAEIIISSIIFCIFKKK